MDVEYVKIAMDRRVGQLLKEYSERNSQFIKDALQEAVFEYVVILNHVKNPKPDRDLKIILNSFENSAKVVMRRIAELQKDYYARRAKEASLLNRRIPIRNSDQYKFSFIRKDLYNGILKLANKYPDLYDKDKKTSIKDVIDRAVLFKISENEELMANPIYREFRISSILDKEYESQLSWDKVIEQLSIKEKVRWSNGD
jgi:hypothetical protein